VDLILDTAEQKGTGQWTAQAALELGVPAPTLVQAVMARSLSALKKQRTDAARILRGPPGLPPSEREAVIENLGQALMGARICTYAQGFALLHSADAQYGWKMQAAQIAATWRAGCIIRARLLVPICSAFERRSDLPHLLLDPKLAARMDPAQQALRKVVSLGALGGVALPVLAGSLAYYDAYRSERLPANLLQAQRDYFGAHGYRRIDKPGSFHTRWQE
jgi:6-phosphogluconate dehydrogenase